MTKNINVFIKRLTIVNVVYAVILIILGFVTTGNWMADTTYFVCGAVQLIASVMIPLRTKSVPESDELHRAELFVQHNWIILALGMAGACTYLAPFVSGNSMAVVYIAEATGILTLLTAIYGMARAKKLTGVDLMV